MPEGTQLGSYLCQQAGGGCKPSDLTCQPYLQLTSGVAGYPGNHLAQVSVPGTWGSECNDLGTVKGSPGWCPPTFGRQGLL